MSRPFRYTFILGLVALATALAAVGGWRYARASAPVNGPIVLVSVDSLRADHLPAYGYKKIHTPALDALAADGVLFERAYSHVPQTLPAHVSLLTGRLPFETGVRDNMGFVVKDDERLVSEMLRDRGFATGAVVSSYLLRKETGLNQGFTFFDDDLPAADSSDPETIPDSLRRPSLDAEQVAERWLNTADTSRLFLFLQVSEPHGPYSGASASEYDAQVVNADDAIDRLVHYLKSHQLYDRSTIIVVSDHGEGLGDHGEREHGLFVYEEDLRVPLIIKQAAGEGAGRRVSDPVQQIDLVPTILDLAKAPIANSLSGRSLKPLLDGSGKMERRSIYAESLYARYHFGWSGLTSVTDGRYRYIRAPREEFYDLRADPAEQHNIAESAPKEPIDRLRHDLKQLLARTDDHAPSAVERESRERLEALGNVGRQAADAEADTSIDPKDKVAVVEGYRAAVRLGTVHQWGPAIDLLRNLLKQEPDRIDLWSSLASYSSLSERTDQATAAYRRILVLDAKNAEAQLGLAKALLSQHRLGEAKERASRLASAEFGATAPEQATAHMLLVEIALARNDKAAAREEADRAQEADARLPASDYVEARLLFDRGRFEEAIPLFEQASAAATKSPASPMVGLDYYLGETLSRAKRYADAERALQRAIASFPNDVRARAAMAVVYRKTERMTEAGEELSAMTRVSPTPETYRLAAGLWTTFGNERQAALVRAEGQRLFRTQPPAARPAQ